jgi:hypothetical protein
VNKKLQLLAKFILFEDTWAKYGSEYMSHPIGQGDNSIIEDEIPISASDLMPNRIAIEKPPVEDDSYLPNNTIQLSKALAAIGSMIPDAKVEDFYLKIKKMIEADDLSFVQESSNNFKKREKSMNNYEKRIRKIIREMLLNESSWGDIKLGAHYDDDDDYDNEETSSKGINKEELKGKHVAKYYNKAGDSGVTVGMQRLFANYLQHIGEVAQDDIKDATDYITYHFVELDPTFNDPTVLRNLRTYVFKKVVKDAIKAKKDIGQHFLADIVSYVQGLRKGDMKSLLKKARSETASEAASDSEFIEYLKNEDPQQYELFLSLFPSKS